MIRHFQMNRMTLAARIRAAAPFVVTGVLELSYIGTTDDGGDSPALGGVT
ncbi:MAG: hypothetical protein JSW46_07740 [Gemmatimonadota bacterium]|nr:MAG: hypothetical protein JSW46_07740 [Gemmatimonadota bacterium]